MSNCSFTTMMVRKSLKREASEKLKTQADVNTFFIVCGQDDTEAAAVDRFA